MEFILRRFRIPERIAGILLAVIIVACTYFVVSVLMTIANRWGSLYGLIAGTFIIYFTISIRSLAGEAKKVMMFLEKGDLIGARKALSQIVGRDTASLNEEQVIRACVETVAENSVDGILSPLFYAFLGGPAGAMAYKAVNTLDSMVGHKDEKYLWLGWASARLDDAANYIPARISAILIPAASFLCGCSFRMSLRIAIRDGRKHQSPNSGIPEAAIAGSMGVQLGGQSTYQGEVIQKPFLGENKNQLSVKSIRTVITILYVTSAFMLVSGIGITTYLKYFPGILQNH